jgi:hypothetical protein
MNLLCLAPDIQEQILFLPPTERGRDLIYLAPVPPIASTLDCRLQRRLWQALRRPQVRDALAQGEPGPEFAK